METFYPFLFIAIGISLFGCGLYTNDKDLAKAFMALGSGLIVAGASNIS